MINWK